MGTDFFFNDFLNYLEREKKYSSHTLTAYRNDLTQFHTYIQRIYEIDDALGITAQMVRSFVADLMNDGIQSRSVNRKISTLKSFFKYSIQQGLLHENPMKKVVSPKTPKRLPVFVEQAKMESLLVNKPEADDSFAQWRDYLVIELLYGTGIRLSESLGLKEGDLNLHSATIKVLGKRNKERIIPITNGLVALIREYLNKKQREGFIAPELLLTNKGLPAYPNSFIQLLNRI